MVKSGLSRRSIAEAAVDLLDEVGLDGLTMRRLAAELGVQNPALYWHFRSKKELLDEMADAIVLGAGMGPPRPDESWQEWLGRRCRAFRQSVLSYSDGARIVAQGRHGPVVIRRFEEELVGLVERGFTPTLALRTISTLSYYTTGFVLQEQAVHEPDARPSAGAVIDDALGRPDSVLAQAIRSQGSPLGDQAFEHGLLVIINGTAAALAAART